MRDFSITFRFCSFLANFSRIWFCISSRLVLPIIYDYVTRAKDVILLPIKEKNVLMRILVRDTMADEWQALKFLGMDLPSR